MSLHSKYDIRDVMSGSDRSRSAGALRLALATVEPFYTCGTILRNKLYDHGILPAVRYKHPVISVGNLTAGGTGKTPMVRWIAGQLRDRGHTVAILSRGYKSSPGTLGDEQIMLDKLLNGPEVKPVVLAANPDRAIAAEAAVRQQPLIDVFLLDDGFQHRRIVRDLDIVLLSATDPFGYGHVLPRGLLREPVSNLRRAGAVVITHADSVSSADLSAIERRVRQYNHGVPIFHAAHKQTGLRTQGAPSSSAPDRSIDELRNKRFFVFSGIGNPHAFHRQLQSYGDNYVGNRWFVDHHAYRDSDVDAIRAAAREKNADILLTTEKDWVKVAELKNAGEGGLEIWRVDVELTLSGNGATELLEQALRAIREHRS